MSFRLLVFDWDGTLMDSAARILACIRAAARDLEQQMPEDAAARNVIGLGLREAMAALFPDAAESALQALSERYRYHFLGAEPTPERLFPGVGETIRCLERKGYLLAVATGKGRRGLDRSLAATGLAGVFHATRCADETCSKPDPTMLLQLMDELDVEPWETLMIGDTEYDLRMAANAGTAAVGVGYGVHAPHRLARHAPLACLDSITELDTWLEGAGAAAPTLSTGSGNG